MKKLPTEEFLEMFSGMSLKIIVGDTQIGSQLGPFFVLIQEGLAKPANNGT